MFEDHDDLKGLNLPVTGAKDRLAAKAGMAAATSSKYSKPSVMRGSFLRFPRAMEALTELGRIGCEKHEVPEGDKSFLYLDDAEDMALDALGRHLLAREKDGDHYIEMINGEAVQMRHSDSIAWNALWLLEHVLLDEERRRGSLAASAVLAGSRPV